MPPIKCLHIYIYVYIYIYIYIYIMVSAPWYICSESCLLSNEFCTKILKQQYPRHIASINLGVENQDSFWLPGISRQQTIFLIHLRFLAGCFHGPMVICDCSAVQSAVCLAAAPVFLLGATRHFVLLSCKICAEIVVYRMLAVFLNGLNGNNSSRRIVPNIFSVYFFIQVSRLVIANIFLSHRLLSR